MIAQQLPDARLPIIANRLQRRSAALALGTIALLVMAAVWVRLPLVSYNLPVVAHPDERGTLGLLWRLRTESLNPHFFAYPSFYFYVTTLWARGVAIGQMLEWARILNLIFGCAVGVASAWLAWGAYRSRAAAVLTAALVLFSPELVFNASYLAVDPLFVLLSVLALALWLHYWEVGRPRLWFAAAVVSGLAVGTKYNAALILVSMMLVEFALARRGDSASADRFLTHRLTLRAQLLLLLFAAAALGGVALSDPQLLLSIVPARASLEVLDVAFIASWLTIFGWAALLMIAAAIAVWSAPPFFERFFIVRPYVAVGVAVIVFFAVTPFAVVSWQEFLLDIGTELKKNALSGEQRYWLVYGGWLRQFESLFALFFAPIGLVVLLKHSLRAGLLLGIYLLLNYLAIGSATRGFERYLSPLLPALYVLSAVGSVAVVNAVSRRWRKRWVKVGLLGLLVIGIGLELLPKLTRVLERAHTTDYVHAGYHFIVSNDLPERVHFEGFVPMFELLVVGVERNWIVVAADDWLQDVGPDDLVMVDGERNELISAETRQQLNLLWSSDTDLGLYIYERIPAQ